MRWTTNKEPLVPPRTIASWHPLEELTSALHFVQAYIEGLPAPGSTTARNDFRTAEARPLKRKASGSAGLSRDNASTAGLLSSNTGLLTPLPSHLGVSRSSSFSSNDIVTSDADEQDWRSVTVYNGILQKKEGRVYAKKVSGIWFFAKKLKIANINSLKLQMS